MARTAPPLAIQTTYAELVDQLRLASVSDWPSGSTFRTRMISNRPYWYVQKPTGPKGRPPELYIGRADEALNQRVARGQLDKQADTHRRILVRSLLAAGIVGPDRLAGDVLAALASAGAFRLRGVLVGTAAYQTYPAFLGVSLPAASLRTGDIDLAQDYGVSVALEDRLETDFLTCLRQASPSFNAVSNPFHPTTAATYTDASQFRVDVVTTNRAGNARGLSPLPALRTSAVPLRFLDFLLRDSIEVAVLHRAAVLVNVPRPERFAVHKLILAAERSGADAKAGKDLIQAESLILALAEKRREDDLAEVYTEATRRGAGWRQRLARSRSRISTQAQAVLPAE